jgi:hypothetical protein
VPRLFIVVLCAFAFVIAIASTAIAASPAGAPTRAATTARAKMLGFGGTAVAIARDALPGARLVAGGPATLGASRLGGRPDLPRGMAWPSCKGRRLSFLAQLRLRDLAAIAPGAVPGGRGVLAVFADLSEDRSGITRVEESYGRVGERTCVVVRVVRGRLARRSAPTAVATLRSRPVRLKPTLTIPDLGIATERYHLPNDRTTLDRWFKLADEAAAGALGHPPGYSPIHQVLGWPSPIQDSPLYGCGKHRSKQPSERLLLQLDFDEPLRFAIGDALYLSGTPADLRAGRFGRLCAEFQEG